MTTDRISLDILKGAKPNLSDFLLRTSNTPVFPLLLLHFTKDAKQGTYDLEVKVGSKLYDLIRNTYGTDQLLLYESAENGAIGLWTFDMLLGLQILSQLNIISEPRKWIINSRTSVAALFSKGKVESSIKNEKALKASKGILSAFELLEDVENNSLLPRIVRDVVSARRMDADTIIHRVALAIFHSKAATDHAVIDKIEDSSALYLNLSQSEFFKSNAVAFRIMTDLDINARNIITKVLTVFSVAAYVYYKQTT